MSQGAISIDGHSRLWFPNLVLRVIRTDASDLQRHTVDDEQLKTGNDLNISHQDGQTECVTGETLVSCTARGWELTSFFAFGKDGTNLSNLKPCSKMVRSRMRCYWTTRRADLTLSFEGSIRQMMGGLVYSSFPTQTLQVSRPT